MSQQNIDHASIIEAWERTHCPKHSRSRLGDHDVLICQKIDEGYTQQAVAELLSELGCPTTHQNLSRYLKRKSKEVTRPAGKSSDGTTISSTKIEAPKHMSDFSQIKEKMGDG